ncbi:alginate export family protein [Sulfurimonas sp.]|uniref:alginate export family protein n=1 Tax=Sulfurimonas sp. TaxID=2022749 RepID=UPI003566DE47
MKVFNITRIKKILCVILVTSNLSAIELSNTKTEDSVNDNLEFSFKYRGRIDSYNGINKKAYGNDQSLIGDPDDNIYLQQIVSGFKYIPYPDYEFKIHMYDSRGYNSSLKPNDFIINQGTPDEYMMSYYDDHLELFEAYAKKRGVLIKELTFTLGRQQLGYGDKRIFGPGNWGNTIGWLWDAAHLSYKNDNDFFDIWYGQVRVKETDDFSILKKHRFQGVGLYSHFEYKYTNIEPFFAWRNNLHHIVKDEENIYYYGLRSFKKTPGLIYDATFAKEHGKKGSIDIRAYGYVLKAGYMFDNNYKTKISFGRVYASGDKDSNDNTSQTFSTPFGATDGEHYGRLDAMAWSNMKDLQASISLYPLKDFSTEFIYHHFNLANANDSWTYYKYKNIGLNSYTHIGDEYDFVLKYKVDKSLDILAIGSYLKAGDFIIKNNIANNNASKMFFQFTYKFNTNMSK